MQEDLKFEGQEEADEIFRANSSPRSKRLAEYERWVDGRQYDGMPSFWDDDKPLWDRAPCIVYPVTAIAIDSYVDLLLGQNRFPIFTSKPGEDESDEDDGLKPDDSVALDRFITSWHKAARFRTAARESLEHAMGTGSVAIVFGLRNSVPFNDIVPAKWCNPTLDPEGNVLSLEIKYPYQEQYQDPQSGKWRLRTKLYRRVIDAEKDTEYLPGDANIRGLDPKWLENPARTVTHGFGFCPVLWYAYMRGCVAVNVIDGQPIQTDITDEIRAHDLARSQWHRGALMSEPQMYEIGVPLGYNPTEAGELPRVVTTEHGGKPSPNNPVTGAFVDRGGGSKGARKRGPGYMYQYPDEAVVGAIFYPGDALKAQEDNCRDLRMKLMEMLGVVLLDPESLKAVHALSGKALEAIKQRQLDRCDKIREDLEDRLFAPAIRLQLRIARALLAKDRPLRVPGAKKAATILRAGEKQKPTQPQAADSGDAKPADSWLPPAVQVKWGEYFRPDYTEQGLLVTMVVAALGANVPIITVRAAVEKLAPVFGINNVDAFLDDLKKEVDERRKKDSDDRAAEMKSAMAQLQKQPPDGTNAGNEPGEAPPAQAGAGPRPKRAGAAPSGGAV